MRARETYNRIEEEEEEEANHLQTVVDGFAGQAGAAIQQQTNN